MAAEWYYSKDGKQHGPLSASELKTLAKSGAILPTDLVWKEGMTDGKPASKIVGLFSTTPPSTSSNPNSSEPAEQGDAQPAVSQKSIAKKLVETAKDAAHYATKQAERTKLTNLNLPPLYQQLGKHAFALPSFRQEFQDLFQQLDKVQAELSETSKAAPIQGQNLGEKAKAVAEQAKQVAKGQKLSLQQMTLFGRLGQAVYEKREKVPVPQELVKPIAETLERLSLLDQEIAALSVSQGGNSWVTPKRLAWSVGGAAGLLCLLVIALFLLSILRTLGGTDSYTQQVLDLTAAQRKEFGVSFPKDARPLFAPGSVEDLIQSLTYFRFAGQIGTFNNHMTLGDGSGVWGDEDMLNGIEQKCKVRFGGGIYMKEDCWNLIYGPRSELMTMNETVSYGGSMSFEQVVVDRWQINCQDGVVLVRGSNRKAPSGSLTRPDEILIEFVHFDEPYESIFPPSSRSGGQLYFDY